MRCWITAGFVILALSWPGIAAARHCPAGQSRGIGGWCIPNIPSPKPPKIGGAVGAAWEHVKGDWGPAINKGANHVAGEVWKFVVAVGWDRCANGTYYGSKQPCVTGPPPPPPPPPPGPTPTWLPDDAIGSIHGPSQDAVLVNDVPFAHHVGVYDAVAKVWLYFFDLQPHERRHVQLQSDGTGHAVAVVRWDHDPRTDCMYSWLKPGDEFAK